MEEENLLLSWTYSVLVCGKGGGVVVVVVHAKSISFLVYITRLEAPKQGLAFTLHPKFVYEQNELRFVCPYFIQGLMLFFTSPFPSFSVTGRALSDQKGSCSLVPKMNCMHRDITSVSFCRGAK